ncbi:MAG: RNA-binding S4 domain-containing protein [Candidatus Krumholzibacteriota bacterium]|nr:RNA-binding S4 domain-containing protein [Candidatus Krumholzibacteriota bacterium]
MRIDLFLKALCLVKTRSQARKGIDDGHVSVNGRPVKPGREIRAGDVVEIRWPHRTLAVEVLEVPAAQIAKKDRDRWLRTIRDVRTGPMEGWHV